MALDAVAHGGGMNRTFYFGGILVCVAGQAQSLRSGRDQLYASYVFVRPNLVATGAAHRNRGMHGLAFGLVFVACEAGGGIRLGIKRNRMFGRGDAACAHENQDKTAQGSEYVASSAIQPE